MPNMNGFELCEKILELDVNIRVCFMSALAVNIQALREVYRNVGFGCFIEKPVSIKYLIERLSAELYYRILEFYYFNKSNYNNSSLMCYQTQITILPHFKKSDRLVCFVLLVAIFSCIGNLNITPCHF